tara:strand:- start:260 stop:517 length:258 start_codon:yes stop_codon:yes gene_type:complete
MINLLKTTGKCAICKFEYPVYQESIEENDTNLEQIRHRALEHISLEYEMLLMTYREQMRDLTTRLIMVEDDIMNRNKKRRKQNLT